MIQKSTLLILCLSMLLWLGCNAPNQNVVVDPMPSEWEKGSLAEDSVLADSLNAIHQDILSGRYGLMDHLLVVKDGKIVMEKHYEQNYDSVMAIYDTTTNHQYNYDHVDWHPYYRNTDLHTLQSVTKSVTSVLMGIAVDDGLIKSADVPAMDYFKAYEPDLSDERKRNMKVFDLLTMQSGIEWNEDSYDDAENSCILMEASEDWISFVVKHPMDTTPGQQFEYNSGASVLLGKIVREATGKRIDQWAEERLFGPLGIEDYYWKITPQGEVDTEGGLYLSAQSLAKIGYLMMHNGQWKGQQLVSAEWVKASLEAHVRFNESFGYGYQWWIPEYRSSELKIFAGNGYGGQFLMCIPEKDLIVLFNGWNTHSRSELSSWRAVPERVIPALQL